MKKEENRPLIVRIRNLESTDFSHKGKIESIETKKVEGATEVKIFAKDLHIRFKGLDVILVEQWGDVSYASVYEMFYGCKNLEVNATDIPDLSNVTNMRSMFGCCIRFNSDLSKWDVSNVTDMSYMFYGCFNFNKDISKWNVSNVTDMDRMFSFCENFNKDISKWNVSNVTDMSYMFYDCHKFNKDISKWDVSNVTDMRCMFDFCENFNSDISNWSVSNVTNMEYMFDGCEIEEKFKPKL